MTLSPRERLAASHSELARVERDIETLAAMLGQHKDSFHHAIGASTTGHADELLERRHLIVDRIQTLLAAHPELDGASTAGELTNDVGGGARGKP